MKLGDKVLASPKGSPPIEGRLISHVDSWKLGKFIVVQDKTGRTHHCVDDEIQKVEVQP